MHRQKKLILTFLDKYGREQKINVAYFLPNMDPDVLANSLASLPSFGTAPGARIRLGHFSHCLHASYVETTTYTLFNTIRE